VRILLHVDCCALKVGVDDVTDFEVHMEAERIIVEEFVRQQQADTTNHSDILVLDSDIAGSRVSSSKKSQEICKAEVHLWLRQ